MKSRYALILAALACIATFGYVTTSASDRWTQAEVETQRELWIESREPLPADPTIVLQTTRALPNSGVASFSIHS